MTGMIDANQIVDPSRARRIEFTGMKLAFIRRHRCKRVAHITNPRLLEINQFNPGNRHENLYGAFRYAGYTWVLVQRNSLPDRMNEMWPECINASGDVRDH